MSGPDPSLVSDLQLFRNLSGDELKAVLAVARTRRIEKKAVAFEQGQAATEFFVLLSGHLKVTQTTADGRQIIVRIVEPGELYGVAVALGRTDYPGTAMAIEECVTLVWPSSAWPQLVERAPRLAVNALQTIGQRLQEAHTRIREFSTEEVERRVAHLLLRIVRMSGRTPGEAADVAFPITRQDVAQMTGTTLFTVSRVLSGWEQQGLVGGGRERITVKEPARLRVIAERAPE
jgi:CRP/FNR family transcriptional regulator, nitrogen oxide reductase regulator